MSLKLAINHYTRSCENRNFSPETLAGKKLEFATLLAYLGEKPYTLANVLAYIELRYCTLIAQNSRYDLITKLKTLTKWLHEHEYIEADFSKKLEKPQIAKRVTFDYYDPAVMDEVITAGTAVQAFVFGKAGDNERNKQIKEETRLALMFLLRTGLRISELVSLSGHSLNISDASFWVVSKGARDGERDLLPIPKDMLEEMQKRRNNERLFSVTKKTCNKALERGMQKLGLTGHTTNHSLRHIFATSLTKQGVPIQTISRLLRHKDIRTTVDYYQHLDINDLSKAVNGMHIVKQGIEVYEILNAIEAYARSQANDTRFQAPIVKKLADRFVLEIPFSP